MTLENDLKRWRSRALAAGIAGDMYRRLGEQNYFAASQPLTSASLVSSQICCAK